jgi:hypothetical protein
VALAPAAHGLMPRLRVAAGLCLALCACGAPRPVSESGFGAFEVSLAAWDDALALAWYDTRDGNAEIYVRFVDGHGHPTGPPLRASDTSDQSYEADIAPLGDDFALAWYEKARNGALHGQLGVWSRDNRRVWQVQLGTALERTRNPVVRAYGSSVFCAWIETGEGGRESVWAEWWNADGSVREAPVRLGVAGPTTWNLNAAIAPDGSAYVVYDVAEDGAAEELRVAKLARGEASIAPLTAPDGFRSKYPDLAIAGDRAALTWFDERDGNREVYLAVGPLTELDERIAAHAQRVTTTPGQSIGAYLAWNGAWLGLAWSDDSSGNYEIYFESFDVHGVPLAPPQRLTDNATGSLIPAIKPWRDRFALAWNEIEPGPHGVHGAATKSEVVVDFAP